MWEEEWGKLGLGVRGGRGREEEEGNTDRWTERVSVSLS